YAISSSFDLTLKYWRVSDGTCIRTFYGHTKLVDEVAFSPIGQTGFKDNKSASYIPAPSLSISPNPFSDRLAITVPSSGAIYSLTGQLVMNLTKGKHSLDTSKWREGIYIVKAGKETKKIIKIN
ncbi:MAG: T9SS type A sorting domain-containing protein, partial [Candidatus Coatesbacteria bacterium]|nr:T9SS type A sorting domain-containing protein [Candidatus Coatesbacteria bacterium]